MLGGRGVSDAPDPGRLMSSGYDATPPLDARHRYQTTGRCPAGGQPTGSVRSNLHDGFAQDHDALVEAAADGQLWTPSYTRVPRPEQMRLPVRTVLRLNHQSRRAIERLGAKQDGILRSHKIMPDGTLRDTVAYSILQHEWSAVRRELRSRLAVTRLGTGCAADCR